MELNKLIRKNIADLQPYSSARDEFKGEASVYLDANENPWNDPFNRYPDPLQLKVKEAISIIKKVSVEQIFLGNGSDEPIDLLYRAFCEPGIDNVVAIEPTYGMYKVSAGINNVEYRKALLNDQYTIESDKLLAACDAHTKIIWLCSPNNPTGNSLDSDMVLRVIQGFEGLVVLDEAYIDFATTPGFIQYIDMYPNLVILQTFSKAWGSAAIRLGMAFAQPEIIQVLNKIKYPYNINILTQRQALSILKDKQKIDQWISEILLQREVLRKALLSIPFVKFIYPTDANFLLVKVDDANALYQFLVNHRIIVRNRNTVALCEGCIRITVGTADENSELITTMKLFGRE